MEKRKTKRMKQTNKQQYTPKTVVLLLKIEKNVKTITFNQLDLTAAQ